MKAISIAYHDVVGDRRVSEETLRPSPGRYTLTRASFRDHLAHIQGERAQVQIIDGFQGWEQQLPVFLTFDDGAIGSYTCVADELERFGWRGHIFIITDWIGRRGFVNRQQIRELRTRGHVIGSHTCSHPPRMSYLGWDELLREWTESCDLLSDIIGERIAVASVANGYYSPKVGQAAAAAGIHVLFNSEPTIRTTDENGCFILGRYSIKSGMGGSASGAIAAGRTWPRCCQRALWTMKKGAKAIAGKSYDDIRKLLLQQTAKL